MCVLHASCLLFGTRVESSAPFSATQVEELSALHIFHQASFDKNDSGYGPLEWHERLAQAQPRLQRAGSGCTSGHYELKPRSWVGETDEAEWDAWIDQTHAD